MEMSNDKTSIAAQLDTQQKKAVFAETNGNYCVQAVAGSGKTRVLAYRIATLISRGVEPQNILLLSFTTKAANEIERRIKSIAGKDQQGMLCGTFHSVACYFLRKSSTWLGLSPHFNIITPSQQINVMQKLRDEHINTYFKGDDSLLPGGNVLVEIFSGAINKNTTFYKYITDNYSDIIQPKVIDNVIDFFEQYEKYKDENNYIDYDGMLLKFYDLLYFCPNILLKITKQYRYIAVDEYQDINWIQHEILKLLNRNQCLFVIGDTAQCIYQFRGSNPRYICEFADDFPNSTILSLPFNYRSSENILRFAQYSINNNNYNIKLRSTFDNNIPVSVVNCKTEDEELSYIINDIRKNAFSEKQDDIAILTRTTAQLHKIKKALKKLSMNVSYDAEKLADQPIVQRLIKYLRYCENPYDPLNNKEALLTFIGVGDKTASIILPQLLKSNYNYSMVSVKGESAKVALKELYDLRIERDSLLNLNELPSVYQYISIINKCILKREMNFSQEKIIELISYKGKSYRSITHFIDMIYNEPAVFFKKKQEIAVMTIHAAKGLEWSRVYLPFLSSDRFPLKSNENSNIQEERNIFYVAVTRAKEKLTITYSRERQHYKAQKSQFIKEIPSSLYVEHYFPTQQK